MKPAPAQALTTRTLFIGQWWWANPDDPTARWGPTIEEPTLPAAQHNAAAQRPARRPAGQPDGHWWCQITKTTLTTTTAGPAASQDDPDFYCVAYPSSDPDGPLTWIRL